MNTVLGYHLGWVIKKHWVVQVLLSWALSLSLFSAEGSIIGIVGGADYAGPRASYAALVKSDGTLVELTGSGYPKSGGIRTYVAINRAGFGILAGISTGSEYAALISPDKPLTPLIGSLPTRLFQSVAINNNRIGLMGGGGNFVAGASYAALVSPDGIITTLSGGSFPSSHGIINSVAINNGGVGIIGGNDFTGSGPAYAALVASDGTLTPLSGGNFPSVSGAIYRVAINDSGTGILGGGDDTGSSPAYAALVAPDGTLTDLSGGNFPSTSGYIGAVSINKTGRGLIAGFNTALTQSYAALVSPSGILTEVSGGGYPVSNMEFKTAAINEAGEGIIGGGDAGGLGPAYAARVSPDGTLTALSEGVFPQEGANIFSVAINEVGIGLIGGEIYLGGGDYRPYIALVAPDGTLTELGLGGINSYPTSGSISSVSLIVQDLESSEVLDAIIPESVGPGNSFVEGIFALTTQVLPNYAMVHHKIIYESSALKEEGKEGSFYAQRGCSKSDGSSPTYSLWLSGFGAYSHTKKERVFPALTSGVGGTMLGLDYLGLENGVIGGGAAYSYNHVHYAKNRGKADLHQEFLTFYGSWNKDHLFISGALWGGIYQLKNDRNTLSLATSTAKIDGKLFIPHFEMGFPFFMKGGWFLVEPFFMIDWAHNWQGRIREHGKSGLNIKVGRTYVSVLRNEMGLRLFQSIKRTWGNIIVEEKGSFINQIPLHVTKKRAAFVGAVSSFDITVFSNRTRNLGALQLGVGLVPCSKKIPYGAFTYQGEFGSTFQSHLIALEIGKYF